MENEILLQQLNKIQDKMMSSVEEGIEKLDSLVFYVEASIK